MGVKWKRRRVVDERKRVHGSTKDSLVIYSSRLIVRIVPVRVATMVWIISLGIISALVLRRERLGVSEMAVTLWSFVMVHGIVLVEPFCPVLGYLLRICRKVSWTW